MYGEYIIPQKHDFYKNTTINYKKHKSFKAGGTMVVAQPIYKIDKWMGPTEPFRAQHTYSRNAETALITSAVIFCIEFYFLTSKYINLAPIVSITLLPTNI